MKEMAEGVDSGLAGFHLRSMPAGGGLVSMGEEDGDGGRRPGQGDSDVLSGLQEGVSGTGV